MGWQQVIFLAERLSEDDQVSVDFWLTVVGATVVLLVALLIVFTISLRLIALKTTRPCRWCMEFIPKSETVCPRCGKSVGAEAK
jgi:hypothetical protein